MKQSQITFIRTKQHRKKEKNEQLKKQQYTAYPTYTSNKWYTKSTAEHCGIISSGDILHTLMQTVVDEVTRTQFMLMHSIEYIEH